MTLLILGVDDGARTYTVLQRERKAAKASWSRSITVF